MSDWALVDNPDWKGKKPDHLKESGCHDRSHFLTIVCACGEQMHIHEFTVKYVPPETGVMSTCKGCRRMLTFEPGFFARAFQEMRDQGWIE